MSCIDAQPLHCAAHGKGGIHTSTFEHDSNHRGGGGFAVRPRNGNYAISSHGGCQRLGAVQYPQPGIPGGSQLWVIGTNGGRHHHCVGLTHILCGLAKINGGTQCPQFS